MKEILIQLSVGVVATLIGALLIWVFNRLRRRIAQQARETKEIHDRLAELIDESMDVPLESIQLPLAVDEYISSKIASLRHDCVVAMSLTLLLGLFVALIDISELRDAPSSLIGSIISLLLSLISLVGVILAGAMIAIAMKIDSRATDFSSKIEKLRFSTVKKFLDDGLAETTNRAASVGSASPELE